MIMRKAYPKMFLDGETRPPSPAHRLCPPAPLLLSKQQKQMPPTPDSSSKLQVSSMSLQLNPT